MTNNEAKQSIERQMIEQVPEIKELGPELFASYLILLRKGLDAFEEFQQNKINTLQKQNEILKGALIIYSDPQHIYHVKSERTLSGSKVYTMKNIIEVSKLAAETLGKIEAIKEGE